MCLTSTSSSTEGVRKVEDRGLSSMMKIAPDSLPRGVGVAAGREGTGDCPSVWTLTSTSYTHHKRRQAGAALHIVVQAQRTCRMFPQSELSQELFKACVLDCGGSHLLLKRPDQLSLLLQIYLESTDGSIRSCTVRGQVLHLSREGGLSGCCISLELALYIIYTMMLHHTNMQQ